MGSLIIHKVELVNRDQLHGELELNFECLDKAMG